MAIIPKLASDFIQMMVDYISGDGGYNETHDANIDVTQGTVFKDVVIDTPAQSMEPLYTDIVYTGKLPSMVYAADLDEDDLDAYAANFGLVRKDATAASGTATFITSATKTNPPTTNIYINAGNRVRLLASSTNPEVQYQVTSSVLIPYNDPLDPLSNYEYTDTDGVIRYAIDAPIAAVTPGEIGNTVPKTITDIVDSITGISKVVNLASTTGGTDKESNVDFANRITLKLSGNNIGTEAGIKSLLYGDQRVKDVLIVKPGDPELLRNQYGGSIDIYVLTGGGTTDSYEIVEFTNTLLFDGTHLDLQLTRTPVESVTKVTGTLDGTAGHPFVQNVDYVWVPDTGVLSGTVNEISKIVFTGTGDIPDAGTYVNIDMTYNKTIEDLQLMFDEDNNHIVSADILVRKAYVKSVSVTINVTTFSGYSPTVVKDAVISAIISNAQALALGRNLNPSDIIGVVEQVDGVDAVNLYAPTDTITVKKYEYVRIYSQNINITINGKSY